MKSNFEVYFRLKSYKFYELRHTVLALSNGKQ